MRALLEDAGMQQGKSLPIEIASPPPLTVRIWLASRATDVAVAQLRELAV